MELFTVLILILTTAEANILLPYTAPSCDYPWDTANCFRGQICGQNHTCIPITNLIDLGDGVSLPEGRCGKEFNDAVCDPDGGYGPCCSKYGWCGDTDKHCLRSKGCQSGCTEEPVPASASSTTPLNEPTLTRPSERPSVTGNATKDGNCGVDYGDRICGNFPGGGCCSVYGYCGTGSDHCGSGCQSGPCYQDPVSPTPSASPAAPTNIPGSFQVVGDSGVPAMHAALLPNGRVVFLDKVEDYTKLNLSNGQLAYSSEYDPLTHERVALAYKTNAFCSGGSFLANGTLLNVGGNAPLTWLDSTVGDGFQGLRYLTRSASDLVLDGEDWVEPGNLLNTARWYASVQTLPDGKIFVASGSLNGLSPAVPTNNNPTYEILDENGITQGTSTNMSLLVKAQPYYLYPFIHLLNDGTLFVFVSQSGEIFDPSSGHTIKSLPELPGDYRTYPNTGGSVLLPLSSSNGWSPDILICGGGAYQSIDSPTDPSCGRIQPFEPDAKWEMDSMPEGRGMVEGTLLPDGTVLWVNGCNLGAEGFGLATAPTYEALIYEHTAPLGSRWTAGANSTIPRLYHSVALLLLDGTLLIAGSNPFEMPVLQPNSTNAYITDFRVEIYTPPYLSGDNASRRPFNIVLSSTDLAANSQTFDITFEVPSGAQDPKVALYHGGFVTHSLHMSHRMAFLDCDGWQPGATTQHVTATMPPSANIAPPGPYVIYIVVDGVPGYGQFVMVS